MSVGVHSEKRERVGRRRERETSLIIENGDDDDFFCSTSLPNSR